MQRTLGAATLAALLLTAAAAPAQTGTGDVRDIQGTWQIQSIEVKGRPAALGEVTKLKIGPERFEADGVQEPATYRLGTEKPLRTIDLTPLGGPRQGRALLGLYELSGDTLKLCFPADPAGPRPDGFTGRDSVIMVLKRERP